MKAFTKEITELLPTAQLPELHARLRHTLDQCGLMLITGEPGVGNYAKLRLMRSSAPEARESRLFHALGLCITPHTGDERPMLLQRLQASVKVYIRDLLGHTDVATSEISACRGRESRRQPLEWACMRGIMELDPGTAPAWTTAPT